MHMVATILVHFSMSLELRSCSFFIIYEYISFMLVLVIQCIYWSHAALDFDNPHVASTLCSSLQIKQSSFPERWKIYIILWKWLIVRRLVEFGHGLSQGCVKKIIKKKNSRSASQGAFANKICTDLELQIYGKRRFRCFIVP